MTKPNFDSSEKFKDLNQKMYTKAIEILNTASFMLPSVNEAGEPVDIKYKFINTETNLNIEHKMSGDQITSIDLGSNSTGLHVTAMAIVSAVNEELSKAYNEMYDDISSKHNKTLDAIKGFETSYNAMEKAIQDSMVAISIAASSTPAVPVTNATLLAMLTPLVSVQPSFQTGDWE